MHIKQKTALLVASAFLLLCLPLSVGAAFTDIKDPQTAENVQILQMLGVIEGMSGGQFAPEGTLTRAQFTKMAIAAQGRADQTGSMKSFTIFPDVKSSHWASGYINLAVRGEKKFISGFADGSFGPEKAINYGEAVTILMRLLNYKDADVGLVWPTGYLSEGAAIGLLDGVSLGADALISRAEAAQLFVNLLKTPTMVDGAGDGAAGSPTGAPFGESVAASNKKDTILLNSNAKTDAGLLAVEVSSESTTASFELAVQNAPTLLQGRRGTLLLDKKDRAIAFLPTQSSTAKDITLSSAKAGSLTDKDGHEYSIRADVKAFYKGKEEKYGDIFVNLRSGVRVTLHLGSSGKVESIFVGESTTDAAQVISRDGDGSILSALAGGRSDYRILRNGEHVNAAALRTFDVATYFAPDNEIQITNFRLSGRYDNAYPNIQAPTKITVMGNEFDVLPSAAAYLSSMKLGDSITLLLTEDAQVAGAIDAKKLSGNAVGIAKAEGTGVSVTLVQGLVLKGAVEGNASDYNGQLVSPSSWKEGYLSLSPITQGSSTAKLDLATRRLDNKELAADVQIFERVGRGPASSISLEDIRLTSVPGSRIQHVRYNDAGKVSLLVLDNVSGDSFTYGTTYVTRPFQDADPDNRTEILSLKTSTGLIGKWRNFGARSGDWYGISGSADGEEVFGHVRLSKLATVSNDAWQTEESVRINNKNYPVSEQITCYNRTSGKWVTLAAARASAEAMTLYVDNFDVVRALEVS